MLIQDSQHDIPLQGKLTCDVIGGVTATSEAKNVILHLNLGTLLIYLSMHVQISQVIYNATHFG